MRLESQPNHIGEHSVESSRIGEERKIFRPEVFEHQKRRLFGSPIDNRPLPLISSAGPILALLLTYLVFFNMTYKPRLEAAVRISAAENTATLSVCRHSGLLKNFHRDHSLQFQMQASTAVHVMQITAVDETSSGTAPGCIRMEGKLAERFSSFTGYTEGFVPAEILLPPRRVWE